MTSCKKESKKELGVYLVVHQLSSSVVVALRLMIVVRSSLFSLSLVVARVSSSRKSSGTEVGSRDGGSSYSDGESCSGRDSEEGVDVRTAGDSSEGGGGLGELSDGGSGLGERRGGGREVSGRRDKRKSAERRNNEKKRLTGSAARPSGPLAPGGAYPPLPAPAAPPPKKVFIAKTPNPTRRRAPTTDPMTTPAMAPPD